MSIQNQQTQITIGLFGFGVVGEGLYKTLEQTPGLQAKLKKVCIKHDGKTRNAPNELFTTNAAELLNDPEINVIVELIDDADAAYRIVTTALKRKKAVVSANKKMIAEHISELILLQATYGAPLLYEAACCASIPIIRNLEEYYDNDLLHSINGIINGSTNYILTRVFDDKLGFEEALNLAQAEGFAESNPSLDIEGIDAANKLSILLTHAYGIVIAPDAILHTGIQNLSAGDAVYAKEKGYVIKLVAQCRKLNNGAIASFVLPQFISSTSQLYNVKNEFNGVIIESNLADNQFFYGKGAGGFPTASAALSDLSALRYNYRYEYKKLNFQTPPKQADDYYLLLGVSAAEIASIPVHLFDQILEWSSDEKSSRIKGIIHIAKLTESNWWKQAGISVILYPDGIKENFEARISVVQERKIYGTEAFVS